MLKQRSPTVSTRSQCQWRCCALIGLAIVLASHPLGTSVCATNLAMPAHPITTLATASRFHSCSTGAAQAPTQSPHTQPSHQPAQHAAAPCLFCSFTASKHRQHPAQAIGCHSDMLLQAIRMVCAPKQQQDSSQTPAGCCRTSSLASFHAPNPAARPTRHTVNTILHSNSTASSWICLHTASHSPKSSLWC
jgi:hypothetical protein